MERERVQHLIMQKARHSSQPESCLPARTTPSRGNTVLQGCSYCTSCEPALALLIAKRLSASGQEAQATEG